ncbi:MAG: D-glycero-beta-D-manno-heptose-7-phosphate kinase [Magnetococcales bacterium]|nr:D-glycero-beta-D-manno-heptose-7-phosphate kinase [Magnetococcales bacterium]
MKPSVFSQRDRVLDTLSAGFHAKSVLVIGDLMLDRYIWGEVSRISPEAPVPVISIQRETERCGGSANVALNLANLGIRPVIAGYVGDDEEGRRLGILLGESGVDTSLLVTVKDQPTITKTRILGGHQQILRIDREPPSFTEPDTEPATGKLLEHTINLIRGGRPPAAILLSDYAKGVLTTKLSQEVIHEARAKGIPVLADPKGVHYHKYRHATVLSPNRNELAAVTRLDADDLNGLLHGGETLRVNLEVDALAVTLSEQGIALVDGDTGPRRIPSVAQEVFDVSGAGDTVIATMAAGLANGLDRLDALHLANIAAGVVVAKVGTSPVTRPELLAAVSQEEAFSQSDKICRSQEELMSRVEFWRQSGKRIVFTNGCFDLLHAGHVDYLERARALGSRLIVGLNTDASVRELKGPERPIIGEKDRARVLAALASVDAVMLFDEETPLDLITQVRPEILAKGADYTEEQVVGGKEVRSWGGRVALVPLVKDRSSSNIVGAIRETPQRSDLKENAQ